MDRRIRGVAERARTPGGAAGSLRSGPRGFGARRSLSSEPRKATRVCRQASMRRKWRNSGFTCLLGGGVSSGTLRHRVVSAKGTGGNGAVGVAHRSPPRSGGVSQGRSDGPQVQGILEGHNSMCPRETPWGPRTPYRNTFLYAGTSFPGVPLHPIGLHAQKMDPLTTPVLHQDPKHPTETP